MKRKASISHNKAIVEELQRDPEFAAEYLRAALKAVGLKLTVETAWPLVLLRHQKRLARESRGAANEHPSGFDLLRIS